MLLTERMNDEKKSIIWSLWKKGHPMIEIARTIEKPPATIFSYLRYYGGMEPRVRTRSPRALSLLDRETISRGLVEKMSIRSIALKLNRCPSTISREIERNGGSDRYRAIEADQAAWKRAKRPSLSCWPKMPG